MGPKEILMEFLKKNPNVANNPQMQGYIDVLNSGDQEKIKTLGMNICNSYGITPDEARDATMRFFGMKK